jgi:hypothetical protein
MSISQQKLHPNGIIAAIILTEAVQPKTLVELSEKLYIVGKQGVDVSNISNMRLARGYFSEDINRYLAWAEDCGFITDEQRKYVLTEKGRKKMEELVGSAYAQNPKDYSKFLILLNF